MSATSGQPGRYTRSSSGMVGALLVTLLLIGAFVALRACNRTELRVEPDRVDYLAQVRFAQRAGDRVVYPASLPRGWYATQVSLDPGAGVQLSLLTADQDYVGFVQSPDTAPALLDRYVDASPTAGAPVRVSGALGGRVTRWDVWTDSGGDTALVARHGDYTLLVFGTVAEAELEQLAGSLTDGPLARRPVTGATPGT